MIEMVLLAGVALGISVTLLCLAIAMMLGACGPMVRDYLLDKPHTDPLPKLDAEWERKWQEMPW